MRRFFFAALPWSRTRLLSGRRAAPVCRRKW
jgi:hypothetical protein